MKKRPVIVLDSILIAGSGALGFAALSDRTQAAAVADPRQEPPIVRLVTGEQVTGAARSFAGIVGAKVNAVAPGWIATGASTPEELAAARNTPLGRAGSLEEVAAAVLFLASDGASYVNGVTAATANNGQERFCRLYRRFFEPDRRSVTPAARLQATIELMHEVDSVARPADAVVSAWFRARRYIQDGDRGQILDLLYALLRHHARLGWWLARHGREDAPRSRLLAWLALKEGRTPDQIKRLFDGAKYAPAILKDQEHALLVKLQGCTIDHPGMPEEVRLECPSWAADLLRRRFRGAFGQEMAALLTPAPLDLRVNPIKSTREAMLGALKDLGLRAQSSAMAPYGIRVHERPSLASLPMLKNGEVEIQDEGSQLVAMLVDARPGERVVDFCAGAGGKTLAIAAQMNNKGHVVACDVMEGRLKRGAERFRQAGLHNIETRLLASETDRWIKRHKGGFDRVLVDAPCSGTGTWRRNPDARWRAQEEQGLDHLVSLQARILASAARLVKPGGRLVYATCSLMPEENEEQVAAFLAAHPAFRAVPLHEAALQLTNSAHADYLSLTPARNDTDGFFAAVMRREGALVGGATHSDSRSIF